MPRTADYLVDPVTTRTYGYGMKPMTMAQVEIAQNMFHNMVLTYTLRSMRQGEMCKAFRFNIKLKKYK